MSFAFNYFIASNLRLAAAGPTDKTYIGNGAVDYGEYHSPNIIDYIEVVERIASQAPVLTTDDSTPKGIVTQDNNAYVWGLNAHGELGTGDTTPQTVPYIVGDHADSMAKVFVGEANVYIIKTDGTLWGAGLGSRLGKGSGDTADETSFIQIGSATNWETMVYHPEECLALNTAGQAYIFGLNAPALLQSSVSFIASAGSNASGPVFFMVLTTGAMYGYSKLASYSNLLPGEDGVVHTTPIQISSGPTWTKVFSSPFNDAVFAQTAVDTYYWGTAPNASYFGLGSANNLTAYSPTLHPIDIQFSHIFPAAEFVLGKFAFNQIYGWGLNTSGALGIGELFIDDHVYTPAVLHNKSAPYYTIPNDAIKATDSLALVTGDADVSIPTIVVSGRIESLINSGQPKLPSFKASGEILTNDGVSVRIPKFSITGSMVAGRVLTDANAMKLTFSASGTVNMSVVTAGSFSLPRFKASGSTLNGASSSASITLPAFSLSGSTLLGIIGDAEVVLPSFSAFGEFLCDAIIDAFVLAMNLSNTAFSTHSGDEFVASAKLGASQLIGRPDGLFTVDGVDDNGVGVKTDITLPLSSYGAETVTHIRSIYLDVITNTKITVTVMSDTGESYSRVLGAELSESILQTFKFAGRRDIYGRSFSIELSTKEKELELNSVTAFVIEGNRSYASY